jgi:hypothetical protein
MGRVHKCKIMAARVVLLRTLMNNIGNELDEIYTYTTLQIDD